MSSSSSTCGANSSIPSLKAVKIESYLIFKFFFFIFCLVNLKNEKCLFIRFLKKLSRCLTNICKVIILSQTDHKLSSTLSPNPLLFYFSYYYLILHCTFIYLIVCFCLLLKYKLHKGKTMYVLYLYIPSA